ncbi:MAG: ABC transporter ATP-binding protein [Acidobacteriota bacterium]
MLVANGLVRRYGDFTAVRDISFSVPEGEILGILGPNGAGKTTTIRMITGFLPPTVGQVTLDGVDLHQDASVRARLGYLPETVALYPEMRVDEYLAFRERLHGGNGGVGNGGAQAIDRAVDACLLGEVRHQIIGTLSKGYRQRVGLAAAILHEPQVLVLDEPTVGLDPKQIIAIRELIRELGRERTLLLSTHILPEVEQLCDRVLIIDGGRIVAEGTPRELQQKARGQAQLTVTLAGAVDAGEALGALDAVPGVASADEVALPATGDEPDDAATTRRVRLTCDAGADPRADVFHLAVERGWVLLEMAERRVSLEDVFVRLTGQADPAVAAVHDGESAETEIEPAEAEPVQADDSISDDAISEDSISGDANSEDSISEDNHDTDDAETR